MIQNNIVACSLNLISKDIEVHIIQFGFTVDEFLNISPHTLFRQLRRMSLWLLSLYLTCNLGSQVNGKS